MAVYFKNKKGKEIILLNPSEKVRKASVELKYGVGITNDGIEKTDKKGNVKYLTKEQRAWRSGYLAHAKDSAKAFKSKHPKYKRKTS